MCDEQPTAIYPGYLLVWAGSPETGWGKIRVKAWYYRTEDGCPVVPSAEAPAPAAPETFDHNDPDWQRDQSLTCPCQFCRGPEISKALVGTRYEGCVERGELNYNMFDHGGRAPIIADLNDLLNPLGFGFDLVNVNGPFITAKVIPIPQ